MEPLYDSVGFIPGPGFGEVDGYFGYRVYHGYIEYVNVDKWTGENDRKIWSHQEFYNQFHSQKGVSKENGVIDFLVKNKLIKTIHD